MVRARFNMAAAFGLHFGGTSACLAVYKVLISKNLIRSDVNRSTILEMFYKYRSNISKILQRYTACVQRLCMLSSFNIL